MSIDLNKRKYKVFFNQVLVFVEESLNLAELSEELIGVSESELLLPENWESWLTADQPATVRCSCDSPIDVFNRFKCHFKLIEAAGGIVENERGDLLVIYRNGKWDLPKGKLEKSEKIKQCAIREVEEETAVSVSTCSEASFEITYHVYYHKNSFVLKPTFWYKMTSKTNLQNLSPQTEEGIDKVEWIRKDKVLEVFKENSYRSIVALVEKYLSF
ncbi:MAG: 8-oxo-dGTP pyrophosphatase MutT (NUDIX family) [Salibacteraceae bacterium]|jgi:8-oxo-dGTP pyrophosphatase MutT (NUDIX family)